MALRMTGFLAVVALGTLAACTPVSTGMGPDSASASNASTVTWTDGKPAVAISCGMPSGCQERALAVCKGNYTTLKTENMPSAGTYREPQKAASVVIRCS